MNIFDGRQAFGSQLQVLCCYNGEELGDTSYSGSSTEGLESTNAHTMQIRVVSFPEGVCGHRRKPIEPYLLYKMFR